MDVMDDSYEDGLFDPSFHSGDFPLFEVANDFVGEEPNNFPLLDESHGLEETPERNLINLLPAADTQEGLFRPLIGVDFADSLTSATADVGVLPSLTQPWETGPMSQLFGSNAGMTVLPKGLSAAAGT